MNIFTFQQLDFEIGEQIWILNEKGEGFSGEFKGVNNQSNEFIFLNYSNGKTENISIEKMQRIERIKK